jgi:ssDNA-binding Zn-finger/Zn-ribbon topoisomerase 1
MAVKREERVKMGKKRRGKSLFYHHANNLTDCRRVKKVKQKRKKSKPELVENKQKEKYHLQLWQILVGRVLKSEEKKKGNN